MKKILIATMLFLLFLPLNAFAVENVSIIKGMRATVFHADGTPYNDFDSGGYLTDDDNKNTWMHMSNKYVTYKLPNAYKVNSITLRVLEYPQHYTVDFYSDFEATNLIGTYTPPLGTSTLHTKNIYVENVRAVKLTGGPKATNVDLLSVFGNPDISFDHVSNLTESHNHNSVELYWENPDNNDFNGLIIKQNGVRIASLEKNKTSHEINNLTPETEYKFEVIAKYPDGYESSPVLITVITNKEPPKPEPPKPSGEITDLLAEAEHNKVDLSWQLPESENFKHVIIYRDTLKKTFFDKLLGVTTVKAAATPIFETNGTYFNDLTVKPETKYEYKLTTLSTEKIESDGVTVQVTTPKAPNPEIGGGGHDVDPETGDYTYYWTEPTTGKVKVMVGGKLYKTVPASDGKIVIPAKDMKYTILGKPDVKLIPVDDDGNEGKPVSPPAGGGSGGGGEGGGGIGEVELPFKVNDLVSTTFQIIGLLAGIILVALAIQLVPRLIEIIKRSIQNGRAVRK